MTSVPKPKPTSRWLLLGGCALALAARLAAAETYVVGYATGQLGGQTTLAITEATREEAAIAEDALRRQFEAQVRATGKAWTEANDPEFARFDTLDEAQAFRARLVERGEAAGAVARLTPSATQVNALAVQSAAEKFQGWPFDRDEAKRRQLAAAELWRVPLEVLAAGRRFVLIPPGEFIMGSPPNEAGRDPDEAQHRVRITRPFYLCRDEEPLTAKKMSEVETWLGELQRQAPAGHRFRLPTEAEWEYAARAGTATPFSSGTQPDGQFRAGPPLSTFEILQEYQNSLPDKDDPVTKGEPVRKISPPLPLRSFAANPWGLSDMAGTRAELVADRYAPYPAAGEIAVDPLQREGTGAIFRGGDFRAPSTDLRSANRKEETDSLYSHPYDTVALRLVLEIPGVK